MKSIKSAVLFLFVAVFSLRGSSSLDYIHFDSDLERRIFETWQSKQELSVDLAIAMLATERVAEPADQKRFSDKFQQLTGKLESKRGGNPVKAAKSVYKHLHKEQILHYQPLAQFKDVLNMGASYNCVTSTALFVTLCRELDIPVQLYLTPNHVFSTVNANGKEIRVEMTDPKKGFGFKTGIKESLDYLRRYKLVTDQEFKEKGERVVYREFVDLAEPIPDAYLLAISYYNQAYAHVTNERYKPGVNAIAKSLFIQPENEQARSLMQNAVAGYLTSYAIAEDTLKDLTNVAGITVATLPREKDFLNRLLDTLLYTVQTHHTEASTEDLEDFYIALIVTFNDYEPLKRKLRAFRASIQ